MTSESNELVLDKLNELYSWNLECVGSLERFVKNLPADISKEDKMTLNKLLQIQEDFCTVLGNMSRKYDRICVLNMLKDITPEEIAGIG